MVNYPRNFRHVTEGIWAGAAPSAENISTLKEKGIKYVLSLDNQVGQAISPLLINAKIHQILIPLEPVPNFTDNLKYLIHNLTHIMSLQPLYIHCLHGADRTGLVIALYRVLKYNYSPDQAINEARKWGYGLGISPATQKFWLKILTVLASSKNVSDIAAVNDEEIIQELSDFHGINQGMNNFPYVQYPSAEGTYPSSLPYEDKMYYNIENKIELLKSILSEQNMKVPMVGIYNRVNPPSIQGAGPIEVSNYDLQQDPSR